MFMGKRFYLAAVLAVGLLGAAFAADAKPAPYAWKTIPLGGGGYIDGFLYHPTTPGILYARTDVGGAYRFDYAHKRWIPLMDGFGKDDWDCMGTLSLAVDPHDANKLYATCGLYLSPRVPTAGVLRSDDRGATWTKTSLPFRLGGNALGRGTGERLQVDPDNGSRILLGTNQDGLWLSEDGAASFHRVDGYPEKGVTFVLFGKGVIYAGSGTNLAEWSGSGGGGVWRSTDGGKTFSLIPGSPALIPHQAALDADGTLYATFADGLGPHGVTNGGVYKLDAAGVWSDISPAHPTASLTFGYSGLDLDRQHPGTLVVSTSDRYPGLDDIYLSHDGGAHWTAVKPQAVHHIDSHPWLVDYMTGTDGDAANRNNMGHWLDAVKINPFDSRELLYGTGYGVWMTHNLDALDAGRTVDFAFDDDNFEETVVLGLESPPSGPKVLMAAGDVGGTAFDDFTKTPSHGLFSPMNKTNQSVAFAALKPNIVVRSVDSETARSYISSDGAQSWTALPSAPAPLATTDWHAHRAGKIAISAGAGSLVWVPENETAYVSKDLGKSWTAATGWPKPIRNQEAISDKALENVFYTFDAASGAILISTDGGARFSPYVTGLKADSGQLRAVPGRAHDLWLATGAGLFHTIDGKPAVAVAGVDAAWQVTFGKGAPQKARAGAAYPAIYVWGKVRGEEGLWRSTDAGKSWLRINDDAHRFGQLRAMAGDPRTFGVLYIAPDGRGTLVGTPQ